MERRLDSFRSGITPAIWNAANPDLIPVARELAALMRREAPGFDLSVAARMVFSCLVDADFRDTEAFYAHLDGHRVDREWPMLADLLPQWCTAFDAHMEGFAADSDLDRRRRDILAHIRARADMTPRLFTLTVPTDGGKTLASLGFALDHAARHGHRRIIFAIPFTGARIETPIGPAAV